MRILVTGASSFVGAHCARLAAAQGFEVFGLHRNTPLSLPGVESVRADLGDLGSLPQLEALNLDGVVHLACKVKRPTTAGAASVTELNARMLQTLLRLGRPVVYASSTVVHWERPTEYGRCRQAEEAQLAASGLRWAVVRPCAPYGPRLAAHQPTHKESFHTLADFVKRLRIVPVPGTGRARRQPVHVDDFNGAILALLSAGLPNLAFDSGGAQALTVNALVDTLARVRGKRIKKVHIPAGAIALPARFSRDFEPELLAAFDTDDVADPGPLQAQTGLEPRRFEEGAPDLFRTV
jgi:nucleoside-diphosphate-sugar epimerase